ncbi:ATP-binding cassette domain-containing protein [Streptomyces anulatus]|uniref:ATP-binding cassette domain-containing protein n=1 Tax=Streptomyces anulatus TaxID=1892 RepID=UPI0036CE6E5F
MRPDCSDRRARYGWCSATGRQRGYPSECGEVSREPSATSPPRQRCRRSGPARTAGRVRRAVRQVLRVDLPSLPQQPTGRPWPRRMRCEGSGRRRSSAGPARERPWRACPPPTLGASSPALRDVSVRMRSGEMTALVRGNGSGKSTAVEVLPGLLLPEMGTCGGRVPTEATVSG